MSSALTRDEFDRARVWLFGWVAAGLAVAFLILILGQPVTDWLEHRVTPSEWWRRTLYFFSLLLDAPERVIDHYITWFERSMALHGRPPGAFIAAGLAFLALMIEGLRWNPYDFVHTWHGSAREARMKDLKRWARKRVVPWFIFAASRRSQNLLDSSGIILGRFRGQYLRSADTLTCITLAAPGSGKTSGIAMPTLLAEGMDDWSIYIFDIKGELYEDTAGWRSQYGPVFRFEPTGRDGTRWNPLSPDKSLPGGSRFVQILAELDQALEEMYGRGMETRVALLRLMRDHHDWRDMIRTQPDRLGAPLKAPLTPAGAIARFEAELFDKAIEISQIGADIESYLWRLACGIVPTPPDSSGNGEHFANTGREALFGMMGFTIFRSLRYGLEPHFGRLIDWWTEGTNGVQSSEGGGEDGDDAIAKMLDQWIDECDGYGYPARYKQSLIVLRAKPNRERGSVISTADAKLNVFKIATVRDRTSTSDFSLDDFRGIAGADGKSRPITFYVVVSLEQMQAMAPILTMLTEAVQYRLISQPAKIAKQSRKVLFLLDEFAQINKMDCLLKGPAVGRGQRVSNLLIAQSYGQIEGTYGQGGLKTLKDTSEWKVIFPLTDSATAKDVSETIGKYTMGQTSHSRKEFALGDMVHDIADGIAGKQAGGGGGTSASNSHTGAPLLDVSDLMSTDDNARLKPDDQVVLVRGRANRPIIAKTPYYFEDKKLTARSKLPPPSYAEARGYCGPLAHLRVGVRKEEARQTGPRLVDEAAASMAAKPYEEEASADLARRLTAGMRAS